jgi:S1-C subfamily serine protease
VVRGGKRTSVSIKLQTPPETRPREPVKVRARTPLAGVTAVNMSPAVADELQLNVTSEGVVIAEVEDGSPASRVGFRKGDLILAVNGERVSASKDLERVLRGGSQMWRITINRGGQVLTSVLGG